MRRGVIANKTTPYQRSDNIEVNNYMWLYNLQKQVKPIQHIQLKRTQNSANEITNGLNYVQNDERYTYMIYKKKNDNYRAKIPDV